MEQASNKKIKAAYLPWIIWGIAAGFYMIQYLARVEPSIMLNQLMTQFKVDSVALGGLAAAFYFAYVGMQIPAGLLYDRFGVRRLLIITTLLCAVSSVMFVTAQHFNILVLARILLGLAGAFAFVGAVKLAAMWFPGNRLGLMVGATQGLGMVGAALGQAPMRALMNVIGSSGTIIFVALLFIILAILGFYFIRDRSVHVVDNVPHPRLLDSFLLVMRNPQSWLNAIYVGMLYAPTVVFGEFWGTSFLARADSLSMADAASVISVMFIGWALGSLVIGSLSDAIGRRKPIMLLSSCLTLVLMLFVLYVHLSLAWLYPILLLLGMANTGVSISYTLASEINPSRVTGTSVAFANMVSILFGAMMQPVIGWFIEKSWTGEMLNGAPYYSAENYRLAMFSLVLCVVISFIAAWFIRETYCKTVN